MDKIQSAIAALGAFGSGSWFIASADEGGVSKYAALGCFGVCASVATAYWRTRGTVITAQAQAAASAAATMETQINSFMERTTKQNESVVTRIERELERANQRAETADQIVVRERMGKHDALDQLQAVSLHNQNLQEILRLFTHELEERGIEVPPAPRVDFGRILRVPDASTVELLRERSDAGKISRLAAPGAPTLVRPPKLAPPAPPVATVSPPTAPTNDPQPCSESTSSI